jgi:two-component system response regulator DegU
VADAQPMFRHGVSVAARQSGRLDLVAECSDAESLVARIAVERVTVAVVGTNVPLAPATGRAAGLGAAMAVRRQFPNVAVVVVSERPRETELFDALRFGAAAYLGRAVEQTALVSVLTRVVEGAYVFDAAVLTRRLAAASSPQPVTVAVDEDRESGDMVSARELEILSLIGRGRSNRAIGESLRIGDQTVKNHVTAILRKLGVSDRTQAVVEAIRLGLIRP